MQFFLSQEVTGKDTALARLNAQIAQLTDLLSLETDRQGLTSRNSLRNCARASRRREGERDRYRGLYDGPAARATRKATAAELTGKLDAEKQVSARARWRRSRCSTSRSRRCAASLPRSRDALDAVGEARTASRRPALPTSASGSNLALAQRVQELSRYRSDFFGRLREILGNRPDIRIVGDRFVFQSEVFFDTGQAVLKPEGRAELDKIAAALLER